MENEIPRRIRIDQFFKQEKLIFEAMQEVEKMPPDTRLTEAVVLLSKAQEKVADFIDSEEGKLWRIKNTKPSESFHPCEDCSTEFDCVATKGCLHVGLL